MKEKKILLHQREERINNFVGLPLEHANVGLHGLSKTEWRSHFRSDTGTFVVLTLVSFVDDELWFRFNILNGREVALPYERRTRSLLPLPERGEKSSSLVKLHDSTRMPESDDLANRYLCGQMFRTRIWTFHRPFIARIDTYALPHWTANHMMLSYQGLS